MENEIVVPNEMDLESNPKSSQLPTLYSQVEKKIVVVRQMPVILDADVASLYGVETKRVYMCMHTFSQYFLGQVLGKHNLFRYYHAFL